MRDVSYADPNDPRAKAAKLKHYYNNNKEKYFEANKRKRQSLAHFLVGVKSWPCWDCGVEYPPWVMQFDHLPGHEKKHTPAMLRNTTWRVAVEEIMKCQEVCANCHAQRTHERKLHMPQVLR